LKNLWLGILLILFIGCKQDMVIKDGYTIVVSNDLECEVVFKLKTISTKSVNLIIFDKFDDKVGMNHIMKKDGDYFTLILKGNLIGKYYGYQIENIDTSSQQFSKETIIADPYSIAVATQNIHNPVTKSIILDNSFNWGNDNFVNIPQKDLVIYEAHLKDMTNHPSSNNSKPGTYLGFVEKNQLGGISHLKDMGYNAIEFLPLFEFANVELPYLDGTQFVKNTWNPYEANHWGYMPTFFFAPEGNYASNNSTQKGDWNGTNGRQVNELKTMVKKLHDNGIAVILDVVYNHISQYDNQPLKQLQKKEYFRLNNDTEYSTVSGCGNDLKTENDDMRKMIIESILYWMSEYHIDGFRFDLGLMIDWETIEKIRIEAEKINPNVFLTCEPWGGGYDPNGFSDRNWSSWNDQIRNAIKGWNPHDDRGFIFGDWHHDFDSKKIKRVFSGSLRSEGGQYHKVEHSVNYLESHDDYTLGDFIRLSIGKNTEDEVIKNIDAHAKLNNRELAIHKLAAMSLLVSQGPMMISQGQEWGRSKVISNTTIDDKNIGKLDHNSYEKDNETNWLNWNHKVLNIELVTFYKNLITIRKAYPALRNSDLSDITFLNASDMHGVGFHLHPLGEKQLVVLLNGNNSESVKFDLPVGDWEALISTNDDSELSILSATSGTILIQK
jgi:pullulanase